MSFVEAGITDENCREIERRLVEIRSTENVEYLIAVESGSRAWGFPSPDSDFDVRFVYLKPRQWYLSLEQQRDVIERPIVDDFDVSGWDVRKTLGLLLKHNAVVSEWINSPIRYRDDHGSIERLRGLVDEFFDPKGYAFHYASLAKNNVNRWNQSALKIPAKRYFYALRPALAIRAIRLNSSRRPPMALEGLMEACELSSSLTSEIRDLVALKAVRREAAATRRSGTIERLILTEMERAPEISERRQDSDFRAALNEFYIDLVDRA